MKILAICGSPKRGNNYAMLNFIGESFPDLDYKIIMLNEVNLEQCRGCYVCVDRGEELCPLKDDRDMILEEINAADGIIMATPVHVNHVSGFSAVSAVLASVSISLLSFLISFLSQTRSFQLRRYSRLRSRFSSNNCRSIFLLRSV